MKDMKTEHIESTIKMIKEIIFHEEYDKYVNVFDRENLKYSNSITDIE